MNGLKNCEKPLKQRGRKIVFVKRTTICVLQDIEI